MITNAFSVDVEEYYHAAIFRAGAGTLASRALESRVERSVDQLLALLEDHSARGTFFILGEIAAHHPAVVRRIFALGHEVGCHGDHHENVSSQTPSAFQADIYAAKARIEDVIGDRIVGYRAPNFSIGVEQRWAYPILAQAGFEYDSSLFPIHHDRYGQADAPRFPFAAWREGSATLLEFPVGTVRVCGVNLPVGGGGHFRLWPFGLTRRGIQRVNIRERQPVMFYLHPWELDADQPRPPMPFHHRFRHYVGVSREPEKLGLLLAHFSFGTARQVLERWHLRDTRPTMISALTAPLGKPA
jgi:polysaccharide deacetylase family protein (PEP-CTERM system associated)